jgi:hypothetical protein
VIPALLFIALAPGGTARYNNPIPLDGGSK